MCVPALFACPACAMDTRFALVLSFCIGGILVSYCLLRPFLANVSKTWGWPRLNVARCASLPVILFWPALFCWLSSQSHTTVRVTICTAGLVLCAVYLWLRGSWLLQQLHVASWFRQVLFLGILGPGLLIAGVIVGNGIVVLLLVGLVWPAMAIPWFLIDIAVGGVFCAILYSGLRYVFCGQASEGGEATQVPLLPGENRGGEQPEEDKG